MDVGIFIPIGNNGWMMSKNAPQYMPSFELNKTTAIEAEKQGFEFLLSMVKLRGFGGDTEFWDHNMESFALMSGLAAVTEKIGLFAEVAQIPGVKGTMCVFDDYPVATKEFGEKVMPLMESRK